MTANINSETLNRINGFFNNTIPTNDFATVIRKFVFFSSSLKNDKEKSYAKKVVNKLKALDIFPNNLEETFNDGMKEYFNEMEMRVQKNKLLDDKIKFYERLSKPIDNSMFKNNKDWFDNSCVLLNQFAETLNPQC